MKLVFSRFLTLLIALVLCFSSSTVLASCDNQQHPDDSDIESESVTEPEETDPEETDPIVTDLDLAKFTIVKPYKDTYGEKDVTTFLFNSIKETYGVELPIKDDYLDEGASFDPEAYEILVGRTAYAESTAAAEGLGKKDYVVKVDGNKIVILGGLGSATQSAAEYFLANCIAKEDNALNVSVELNHNYKHEYKYAMSDITICSLNLRTADNPNKNTQSIREPLIADFVATYKPDSIGTQECEVFWRIRLDTVLVGYERAMSVPTGVTTKNYIWYNPETLTKIDSGVFWLSETPDKESKGFGSKYYISCCWAIFEVKATGARYVHFNAHLDAYNADIREKEIEVLLDRVQPFLDEGYAVLMTGDYNCTIDSNPAKRVLETGFISSQLEAPKTSTLGTFNSFKDRSEREYTGPIDFIFANENATPNEVEVIDKWPDANGVKGFMSDHNAVFGRLTIYG